MIKNNILNKKAITIVELIIVIGILAILGVIGFISYQNYNIYSRDTVRVSDINNLKSSVEYVFTESGKYPLPDNGKEVTYLGETAWIQGDFGKDSKRRTKKLDKIPLDPLTGNKYTYSITKKADEYEFGGVFEGDEVVALNKSINIGNRVYADNNNFKAYISGNYNGQVLKVRTGSIDYVLAVPSIIASNLSNLDLKYIIENKKLSITGNKNIPSSYGIDYITKDEDDLKLVNKENLLAWSGSSVNKLSFPTERLKMITNLQKSYSGTLVKNKGEIGKITLSSGVEKMKHAKDIATYILKIDFEDPKFPGYSEPENICAFPITIGDCIIE